MKTRNSIARPVNLPRFIPALLAVAVLLFAGTAYAAKSVVVDVTLGKSVVLTTENLKKVSITNPDIADVLPISAKEIQINGKKAGSTSMIVWDKSGAKTFFEISVNVDTMLLEERIKELAPGDNINVKSMKNTIIVTGTVTGRQRQANIDSLLKTIGKNITSKELVYLQGGIVKEVDNSGSPEDVGVRFINMLEVIDVPEVLLQITVASIDRKGARDLGINWAYVGRNLTIDTAVSAVSPGLTTINNLQSGSHGGSLTTDGIKGATFGVIHGPSGTQWLLQALASKGLAKILAEPNLLVKSGETGTFLAGGEVPIPVVTSVGTAGGNAITVEYKEFGVRLNFKPEVTDTGNIRLAIDPAEVSSISGSTEQIQGNVLPIFSTSRVSTSVDLKEGESFMIAGLINNEWSKNLTKMPILGDLPIIGAFFRTQSLDKTERELVFFVTPKLSKPMAPGADKELPGMNEPTPAQSNDMRWIPLLPTDRSIEPEKLGK